MSITDLLVHNSFLDPRTWGEVDLFNTTFPVDREAPPGEAHFCPDRKFSVEHLKLDLRFDEEKRSISGTATLRLSPFNDGFDHFDLDIAEMEIHGVRIPSDALPEAPKLTFETHAEKLAVELNRAYRRAESLTIEIAYSCRPRKGLYFIQPDDAYPSKPRQIWSQGENEDAHWWFPCADVTNQKMTTELIATVNAKYIALSNGELLGTWENAAEGTRTYHWSQAQPHPAYLVSVVIGDFEVLKANFDRFPIDYYVYKDRVEAGRRLFLNTPRMIEFFEQKFGYPFPYAKYSQVVVEDFLFGAMENTSASTFTDRCLLDDRALLDFNYEDIVAHELAHQWWGDLVTCKDWTQIWLNESFATYSEFLWREHTEGADAARFVLYQDFLTYLREDRTSHRRPLDFNCYRFSDELMDRHAYEKGACILDMLRFVLGDEAFFRSLSHYLHKFEFGVAESNDFKVAIEEATGQNLYWFFDQWVYGAGYPELEVGYEWQREQNLLKLTVKQVQELKEKTHVFRFPAIVEIVTHENGQQQRSEFRVWVEKQEQEFIFYCASKPRLVTFDKGHRIFKLMHFPKSAQELMYQLANDPDTLGRARAARELAIYKSEEAARVLREVLLGQDFYGVRMAAAVSLGEIGSDAARSALLEGYHAAADACIRRSCILSLGHFKDDATIDLLRDVIEKEQSYFVPVAAIRALAHIGGEKAFDTLRAALAHTSWQEVIAASVFHGFSHAKEKRAVDLAIECSAYGKPIPLRAAAIGCLGALGKELRKEKADGKIVDTLLVLVKDQSIRARVAAIRALGKIGNRSARPALLEAQQHECLDQLKGALLDALKCLEEDEQD